MKAEFPLSTSYFYLLAMLKKNLILFFAKYLMDIEEEPTHLIRQEQG